jgi:hypothetical protein
MSNLTPIYWEFNGVSLHTHAWAIDTFGGNRYTPPPKRGDDLQVPFRRGKQVTKKVDDARSETLRMWLRPRNQDGTIDPLLTPEQKLHENWLTLIGALRSKGPAPFIKRWWEGSTVASATGQGEILEFPEPDSSGMLQRFSVDIYMADPFFYGATINQAPGTFTIEGTDETQKVIFDLNVTGPARVEMSDGNWFEYSGGAGHLVVDASTGLATLGGVPVNGMMTRNYDFWNYAEFTPGPFTVNFISGISSGSINYSPAFW